MRYIIMDLEWNNTYGRRINGFINEVIEIGAVKLDDQFQILDTFSCFIKSQIGKKLRGSVKRLTNITNEDINSGTQFTQAFAEFRRWLGSEKNVVLTWGDGDIRVLIDNYKYLNGIATIPFLTCYADLQRLFQVVYKTPSSKQVGLAAAAEMLCLKCDDYAAHRALDDSLLSVEIFKKCYDAEQLDRIMKKCDSAFYERLSFKAYAISKIDNPLVDLNEMNCICESCKCAASQITEWKYSNQYFRAVFSCELCNKKYNVGVRFKKYYDRLDIRKIYSLILDNDETTCNECAST